MKLSGVFTTINGEQVRATAISIAYGLRLPGMDLAARFWCMLCACATAAAGTLSRLPAWIEGLNMNRIGIIAAMLLASTAVQAQTVHWTDWTSAGGGNAGGTIAAPGGAIGVGYTGGFSFVQTGCGTAYWAPGTYNGPVNKPFDCDIVALNAGGLKTISFDKAVTDPFVALMSWNGNTVSFSAPFELISNGSGFWGSGTPVLNEDSTGFFGNGEVHAIIRFSGTFTSISFTDTTENWHGFTVGVADVAPPNGVVPEPAMWGMMIVGFGLVGAAARRRRMALA